MRGAGIELVQHDVTALAAWTPQLAPGGRLLLEEVEWIRTDDLVFRAYLAIVDAMIRAQGGDLYLGPRLDAVDGPTRVSSRVVTFAVPPVQAARLFRMNLHTWRENDFIRATVPTAELDALERQLQEASDTSTTITWGLRQVAFAHS